MKHITFQTEGLGMSKPTVVDIPPEPRKQNLTMVKLKPISIASMESPYSGYSKPNPQPSPHKAFTLDDFKNCAKQAEDDIERRRDREKANDLSDLRRLLNLPP